MRVLIYRTLVDNGSSINVLYSKTLKQMRILEMYLQPYFKRLQGFIGDPVEAQGKIALIVELRDVPYQRITIANFVVVDLQSSYNAILGRLILHKLKAAMLIYHYCMKVSHVIFDFPEQESNFSRSTKLLHKESSAEEMYNSRPI